MIFYPTIKSQRFCASATCQKILQVFFQNKINNYDYYNYFDKTPAALALLRFVLSGAANRQENKVEKRLCKNEKYGLRLLALHFNGLGKRAGYEKFCALGRTRRGDEIEPQDCDRSPQFYVRSRRNSQMERGERTFVQQRQSHGVFITKTKI